MAPHYTPAAYLGHFASPDAPDARKSLLWAFHRGARDQKQLRAGSVAAEHDVYSTSDPNSAESLFQFYEGDLRQLMRDAVAAGGSKAANRAEAAVGVLLIIQAHVMLFRNPILRPSGSEERIDSYRRASQSTYRTILLGQRQDESLQEVIARSFGLDSKKVAERWAVDQYGLRLVSRLLHQRWNWRVIRPKKPERFITSDNPAHWYQCGRGYVVTWPLSPKHLFVSATTNEVTVLPKSVPLSIVHRLNDQQVAGCYKFVASADRLDKEEIDLLSQHFERHPMPASFEVREADLDNPMKELRNPDATGFLRSKRDPGARP